MDASQRKVQTAVSELMSDLDRSSLRRMQRDTHLCSADCCRDDTLSMEAVQNCIQRCTGNIDKAQKIIEAEMNNFQERLVRCSQACRDKIRDQVKPDAPESEIPKYQSKLELCVDKCANEHVQLLTSTYKPKLDDALGKLG